MFKVFTRNKRSYAPNTPWSMLSQLELFLGRKALNTQRRYRTVLREFCGFLGGEERLETASLLDAARYCEWARGRPSQPGRASLLEHTSSESTVSNKVTILHSLFEQLRIARLIDSNPFTQLKSEMRGIKGGDRRPHELIPYDKIKTMLNLCPETKQGRRDRAILALLFGCALRRSEAINLRLHDVKRTIEGTVYLLLRKTKTKTPREIACADWVAAAVSTLLEQRQHEGATELSFLFVPYRPRNTERAMDGKTFYRLFKGLCKRAGLTGTYSPHSARVTAITRALDLGMGHRDVQQISGHASVQMVEHYDRRRLAIDESPAKKLHYK